MSFNDNNSENDLKNLFKDKNSNEGMPDMGGMDNSVGYDKSSDPEYSDQAGKGNIMSTIVVTVMLLAFLAIGIVNIKNSIESITKGVDIQATVTNVKTERRKSGSGRRRRSKTEYIAYVSYEYNGQTYDNIRAGKVSMSTHAGEKITVRINPDKPSKIYNNGYMGIILGGIFVLTSGFILVNMIRGKMRLAKPGE